MKPNSTVKFANDEDTDNNNGDKFEFAKFYNKLIKPQIDELAALLISSSIETQLDNIEDLTNSLFSNLEKLDSDNIIVLNGYKVVSRSYFILNCKHQEYNKYHNQNDETSKKELQSKIIKYEKQNEEILERMTKYLEEQKNQNKSKNDFTSLTKEFKKFKDNVNQITSDIANQLNLENVSDVNDLSKAIEEFKNQKDQQINLLINKIKELKQIVTQLKSPTEKESEKSLPKLNKDDVANVNLSLKTSNELMPNGKSSNKSNSNHDIFNYVDLTEKELINPKEPISKQEKQQLISIISQKDELINELKNERDKLKQFVNKSIFSNMPTITNQNELDDPIKLKTDLNLLKVKYDKINASNVKLKAKVKKLNKLESLVEQLKAQINEKEEEKQIQLSKLTLEKDQLQTQLSDQTDHQTLTNELNSKTEEIKNLKETMDQIQNQLKEQCQEIAEENKVKSSLIKIVEKQSSVLSIYEKIVIDKMKTISTQETEKSKFTSILKVAKQQEKNYEKQFDELFEELILLTNKKIDDKSTLNDILFALKNHRKEDIVFAFQKVASQLKALKTIPDESDQVCSKAQIDKLYNCIMSLIKTLRTFVNNNETDSDQKSEILRECIITDSFVHENAPGLIEEPTIFDAFDINVDESLFLEQITSFVNNFKELESNQAKELFSILTYVIVMNTILRKTAFSYRDQCEIRTFEVKKLKNKILELQQKSDDLIDFNQNVEEEKAKEKDVKSKSANIQEPNEVKQQYLSLKETYEKTKKDYNSNLNKYKKKVDFLTKQNNELRNKLDSRISILNQASQVSEESNAMIKSLRQEISNRDLELDTSHEVIQKQREEIEALKNSLLKQTESLKLKQKETILKEKQNSDEFIQEIRNDHQIQLHKIQQQNKIKIAKLNDELNCEKNRYLSLRNKFEDIFDDLRNQLNESRGNEMKMKLEFSQKDAEITTLKGRLSALNIDNKMMKVKFANLEEKTSRERAFNANQTIAQQIAIEQQTTAKLNELEISMKNKEQNFLQSLCFILRDYVNENEIVSSENVKIYLQNAMDDIEKLKTSLKEAKIIANEIIKIRSIIKPPRSKSTSEAVQELVNQRDELTNNNCSNNENDNEITNNNSNLLKVWNSWARKVLTLASDTTCIAKSDKELRNAIEEFIIQNSMVKNNHFMIESLRKQKNILLSKIPLRSQKKKGISILPILIIFAAIRRMQKMSGNLHSDLVIPNIIGSDNLMKLKRKNPNYQKNYPLIISYE